MPRPLAKTSGRIVLWKRLQSEVGSGEKIEDGSRGSRGGQDAERIPDYENEEAGRAEFEHEVEDLSFGDNVHAPKPKHRHPALFSAVTTLIVLLVLALGAGAWYMWQYHWRTLSIEVDGTAYSAKADTTVAAFRRDHRDFERKPGRLLSVEGKVLEPSGGNTVSVKFDGKQIEPADWDHTRFEKNGTLTVTPGTDLTEEHTVEQRKVPFKTDINLNGGPVQIVTQQGEDGLQEFWVGRQSKKTAAKTVIRKQEPLIVKSFAPRPEGKKVIALTFDDGPSIYSDKILDILKQNKVKATFFELGEPVARIPEGGAAHREGGPPDRLAQRLAPVLPEHERAGAASGD